MKRSDLVPGCKAIIVSGAYTGKIVKCIKFIGNPEPIDLNIFAKNDVWEIDKLLRFTSGHYYNMCTASIMQRIDDDINHKEISENSTIDEVIHD